MSLPSLIFLVMIFLTYIFLALDQHLAEATALREALDQAQEVLTKQTKLVETLRESFFAAMGRVRASGRDPAVVLTHLSSVEAECFHLSVDDFAFLATSFHWDSPLFMPDTYTVEEQAALAGLYGAPDLADESKAEADTSSGRVLGPETSDGLTKLLAPPLSGLPPVAPSPAAAQELSTSIEVDPREGAEVPEGTGDASSEGPVA